MLAGLATLFLLVPFEVVRIVLRGGRRAALAERLGRGAIPEATAFRRVVIHAVSVGEMRAAAALVHRLAADHRDWRFVLTSGNRDGLAAARELSGCLSEIEATLLLPWDRVGAIDRWLERLRPALFVVVETELWPALFHVCDRRRVPLCIVNGRIYPRDLGRYRRARRLFRGALSHVRWIGALSERDRRSFETIGASPGTVEVVGDLKYDVPVAPAAAAIDRRIGADERVLLASSTHAPEERWVLDAFARLRVEWPALRCVLAPRQIRRAAAVLDLARGLSLRARRWSAPRDDATDVWVVDEMGRLPGLFERAEVVFVGGSLARRGGHNILEPAACGRPIVIGPHVEHFRNIVDDFVEANALIRLTSPEELHPELRALLADETRRRGLAERARERFLAGRGRAAIYSRRLAALL
jgi:3-deoxy-D-manno-octulosonic-acid transferase